MILIDYPYASTHLKEAPAALGVPTLDTPSARELCGDDMPYGDRDELAKRIATGERVYTNSENSLGFVLDAARGSDLARQIDLCKDKGDFREAIKGLYPDYFFQRVAFDALDSIDPATLPVPFVIKPARGFFSLGVHVVLDRAEWPDVLDAVREEVAHINDEYPEAVVDSQDFLIEQAAQGEEYAVDVYYDADGEPTIVNIMHHVFPSAEDVSDRLYYTSATVMREKLAPFGKHVRELGEALKLRNFCMHLEIREDADGTIIPIEANPLRFGGWCVADMARIAWGTCAYDCYLNNKRPDWDALIKAREGTVVSMCIGDVPGDVDRSRIASVDLDGFGAQFDTVLEMRPIDYAAWPVFAFCFAETTEDRFDEVKSILSADFGQFIRMKSD